MAHQLLRATRRIDLGNPRLTILLGETIKFDGNVAIIQGREFTGIPVDEIASKGWLVPDAPIERALVPVVPQPLIPQTGPETPSKPNMPLDVRGERIPFWDKDVVDRDGKRPPSKTPHSWGHGVTPNSPAWLNDNGGTTRTCKVCGVTERFDWIQADRTRGDGTQMHRYTDVYGHNIISLFELHCPVFVGHTADSGVAMANERIRDMRDNIDVLTQRVEALETSTHALEEMLRVSGLTPNDLAQMISDALHTRIAVPEVKALPAPPLFEDTLDFSSPEREAVLVSRDGDEST